HCHDLRDASGGLTPRLLGWLTPGVRPILMHRPVALHVPGARGPSVHPRQSLRVPGVVYPFAEERAVRAVIERRERCRTPYNGLGSSLHERSRRRGLLAPSSIGTA